jgi:molybdate transport system permease protein
MDRFELEALSLSLQVALTTLLLSTHIALVLATLMARTRWRGKIVLDTLILLPMGLPPAVVGFGLLMALSDQGPLGGWLHDLTGFSLTFFPAGAILAASLMTVPLMVRVLRPAFEATDPMLLPVARTLGASRWQGWLTITLPLAWPAIASAMALGLAAAWGESGATLVLAAALHPHHLGDTTAPVAMVEALLNKPGDDGAAVHLAIISLGIALAAVVISELGRRHWRRRWQARLRPVGLPSHASR